MSTEIKMTEEIKEQLFSLLPMTKGATIEFTPKFYMGLPEEVRPTFTLEQMSEATIDKVREMAVQDQLNSMNTKKKPTAKTLIADSKGKQKLYYSVTSAHITRWEKLYSVNQDKEVILHEYSKGEIPEVVPDVAVVQIFTKLLEISGMAVK